MLDPAVPHLSYQDALTFLEKAVADKGADYVYENPLRPGSEAQTTDCRYFDAEQQPSCILGHVLVHLGVKPFDFYGQHNTTGIASLIASEHPVIALDDAAGVISYDNDSLPSVSCSLTQSPTYNLIAWAQSYSDKGVPWGQVVEFAKDGGSHGCYVDADGNKYWA